MSDNLILPRPPLITSQDRGWDGVYLQHDRQPAFALPQHSHSQHTIVIGLDNVLKAEWSIDGQFQDLQYNQGDVFIVPAGADHRAYWKQESEGILLSIEPASMISTTVDLGNSDRLEIVPQFATSDSRLSQIAQWLLLELHQQQMGSRLYVESLITMLEVHLLRSYSVFKPTIPDYQGGLAKYKLDRAIAFIHENLAGDFKLQDLATLVDLSPYHFARMFKQSTGMTPHQYLVEQRIDRAKELLHQTQIGVGEIGYLVGYKNASHFARVFRQQTRVSPTDYRNL